MKTKWQLPLRDPVNCKACWGFGSCLGTPCDKCGGRGVTEADPSSLTQTLTQKFGWIGIVINVTFVVSLLLPDAVGREVALFGLGAIVGTGVLCFWHDVTK